MPFILFFFYVVTKANRVRGREREKKKEKYITTDIILLNIGWVPPFKKMYFSGKVFFCFVLRWRSSPAVFEKLRHSHQISTALKYYI
jgi:hypothetical protein